jgi:ethanolamine ammonia-lyase large subunit
VIYRHTVHGFTYDFKDLRTLLAKATPFRSGDELAGICASTYEERVAAQMCLAEVPLDVFLHESVIPYENDEVTRLIMDTHDRQAFRLIEGKTVGEFRDWLLSDESDTATLASIARGLTPEMAAAVSKTMRNQDLILVGAKCRKVTAFRNTIGLAGRFSSRIQPNHPFDDLKGIAASIIDGLLFGCGDAVIGINPASDHPDTVEVQLRMMDRLIRQFDIPTQSCVLTHVTTTMQLMQRGVPVDLVFQSIGGTQKTNEGFGISLSMLKEAHQAALETKRGTVGANCMYFETGQGSSLSSNSHHGVDQQTLEARAYAVARHFDPLLVNSVVGFIGPEYLYDGKQITRAALEDNMVGKLLGLPMGLDLCFTNHAASDFDDLDNMLLLAAMAGTNFIMGVPGSDDIMLHYQSTSYHDVLYVRKMLGLRPAPEFEQWLVRQELMDDHGTLLDARNGRALISFQGDE